MCVLNDYSKNEDDKLLEYSERESFQRIIIRASGDDNYPGIDSSAHTSEIFLFRIGSFFFYKRVEDFLA